MEKNLPAQLASVIDNLVEIKQELLKLDESVARKEYDELKRKYDAAQVTIKKFYEQKNRLETELKDKPERLSALTREISSMFDTIENTGTELRQVEKQNFSLENALEKAQRQNIQLESALQVKSVELDKLSQTVSALFDKITSLGEELRQVSARKVALENSVAILQQQNAQLQKELQEKSEKVSALSQEISRMYDTLENTGKELRHVDKQNLALGNSLEKILPMVEEQTALLENYFINYYKLERIYNAYKKLSDNTKFALEGIFGAETSPTSFLAGVLQEGHLESLFDYVATALNNGAPSNETEILKDLFEFAFDAANTGRREKIYARLKISEGNTFDNGEMKKTSSSQQSGKVKKVLLAGYKYYRTDKIIRQSLVVIG